MVNILYNTKTREAEQIPEENLPKAILDGTHAYQNGVKINIVGPDGQVRNVDSSELQGAIQEGYFPETSRQAAVRQYVDENKGLKGTVKVGLGQFADEALLSIPETAYDLTADPLEVAKKEALKKEHSIANTLGGIGGFGASMFIGGPLFKAAEVAGHGAERLVLGGAAEAAERAAVKEGIGEAAGRGLDTAIGSTTEEVSGRAAGATEGVGTKYAPYIDPNAGLASDGAQETENVFGKSYQAQTAQPREPGVPVTPNPLDGGDASLQLNDLTDNFAQRPQLPEGYGQRALPPGSSSKLGFPDMEGEVVPTGTPGMLPGNEIPRLGPSTDRLGFPDMEGEIIPPGTQPGQLGAGRAGEPPGAGQFGAAGESPIKMGPLDQKTVFSAKENLTANKFADKAADAFHIAGDAVEAKKVGVPLPELPAWVKPGEAEAQAKALEERLIAAGLSPAEAAHAAPSLARKVLASAINQGVQAGVIAAPKTITEALLGDPSDAAEHFVMNVGAGAVLGAVGGLAGRAVKSLVPNFGKLAEEQAFRNLSASKDSRAVKAAMELKTGGYLGVGRTLLNENLLKGLGEDFEDYAARIDTRKQEVGQGIGKLYADLDGANSGVIKTTSTTDLANLFRSKVIGPLSKVPGNQGIISKVEAYIGDFERIGNERNLTLNELHNWRQGLDDLVWREGQIGITDTAKKQLVKVRGLITNELEETGAKISEKMGMGDFKKQLKEQNLLFAQLKVAHDTVGRSVVAENSNRLISPTDYIGAAIGSAAGGPLGIIAGGTINHYGRKNGNSLAARALDRLANTQGQTRGILMAEKAMANSAKKVDSIPELVSGKVPGLSAAALSTAHLSAINRFIGVKPNNDDLKSQYNAISERINYLQHNPEEMTSNIAGVTSHLSAGGAPQIGGAATQKYQQVIGYVASQMPRPTLNANQYEPKIIQDIKGLVNEGEMQAFAKKVAVINDPFIVFQKMGQGTLTLGEVTTMKDIYPSLYQTALSRIQQSPHPLNYAQRANLDLFAHADLAGSQGAPTVVQPQPAGKGKGKQPDIGVIGKPTSGKKFDIRPNSAMTDVSALQFKNAKGK